MKDKLVHSPLPKAYIKMVKLNPLSFFIETILCDFSQISSLSLDYGSKKGLTRVNFTMKQYEICTIQYPYSMTAR